VAVPVTRQDCSGVPVLLVAVVVRDVAVGAREDGGHGDDGGDCQRHWLLPIHSWVVEEVVLLPLLPPNHNQT